ncbi:hypothetical protein SEPCBS57363_004728 [Sporothrix epigloea]|uniref:Ubiquitin interaction motif protein n=1 Tax=Sporothrix epigloea TaxID=1892477 RepID=A0ABP0DTX3_9PEZI
MSQPYEAAIVEVCEFANLDLIRDRELVISALKDKNGSIQDVVLSYYDDPSKFRQLYTWDETSFMGDRDHLNGSPTPNFTIHDSDYNGSNYIPVIRGISPSNNHTVAPSRPPSRAQSPLSGLADWNSSGVGRPLSFNQEEKELAQALAESNAMSSLKAPHNLGITNDFYTPIGPQLPTHVPYFCSASRGAYDPNQWAMVQRTIELQEPGASGRMRAEGSPAFLRGRQTGHDSSILSALLTILHAIPLARNNFLKAGEQPASYGQDSEWWKGGRIQPAGVLEADRTMRLETVINNDSDDDDIYEPRSIYTESARELIDEIHRLMAFLDGTTRAYGTADRITESRMVQEGHGSDACQNFFEALRRLAIPGMQQTFYSYVQLLASTNLSVPTRRESFAILEIKVDAVDGLSGQLCAPNNLYSAMDNLYWDHFHYCPGQQRIGWEGFSMAVISRLAPVQILHLNASSIQSTLNEFDIPAVLYLDRYLDENKKLIANVHLQLQKVYEALQRVDEVLFEIKSYMDRCGPGQPVVRDKVTLSEQAISLVFQKEWHQKAQWSWDRYVALRNATRETATNTGGHEFDFSVADVDVVQPLTEDERNSRRFLQAETAVHIRKLRSIQIKSAKLNEEKKALVQLARCLQQNYTTPKAAEDWSPSHEYVLRGVILSPTKFYFCRTAGSASQKHDLSEPAEIFEAVRKQPIVELGQGWTESVVAHEGGEIKSSQDKGQVDDIRENNGGKISEDHRTLPAPVSTSILAQWWMVEYDTHDGSPITLEKSTVDIARAAALSESKTVTLIYAEKSALDEETLPLSLPLSNFVRFDNRFFKQELKDESLRSEKKRLPAEEASPTSPLKRHQRRRSASIDSVASNMASFGDDSSYDAGGEGGDYMAGMDLDVEKLPLLDLADNEVVISDDAERPFDSSNAHDWTSGQTLKNGADADQQNHHVDGSRAYSAEMNMAAEVLPQREVDTPAVNDNAMLKAAAEPFHAVSADLAEAPTIDS